MINMSLARSRGLSDETIKRIEACQFHLNNVLFSPSVICDDPRDMPEHIREIEFRLQELWGFPQDENFHRYGYRVRGCTCPVMDNDEYQGTKYRIYFENCPYHGSSPATSWDDSRFDPHEETK